LKPDATQGLEPDVAQGLGPDVTETPMVEISSVHKFFGDLHVLRGVDLVVPRGSVCAILGPSGSGKSTLLRCINVLEEIQAGQHPRQR
jgi:polar amino acid transport system ATP-binding protein